MNSKPFIASLTMLIASIAMTMVPASFASAVDCTKTTSSGSGFTLILVCVEAETETVDLENPTSAPTPAGTWVIGDYVCASGPTCSGIPLCSDGTPPRLLTFVLPDGSRGDERTYCASDADEPEPEPEVTPPTQIEIFAAFQKAVPSKSTLQVQPPGGQTLVNFETIFSTVADPVTTGQLPLGRGFQVQFEMSPKAFSWQFGDGDDLTTDWAGRPWAANEDVSTLITHTYTSTDPVKASVTVTWGATYRLNGGPPQPVDGTVNVTSAEIPLEILEAKPQLVE